MRPSLITAWLLAASILILRISDPPRQVLTWDVFGYYLYLPATFIHDDLQLKDPWLDQLMEESPPSGTLYQVSGSPKGGRMIKYTMGMAVVYAPFFFIAHYLAHLFDLPTNGLSLPYQLTVAFGCLLYILIGIFLLRRVLLHFFTEQITAVVLVAVVLGTNFLHLSAWDGTLLTHPTLFTLYAAIVLLTIRWHARPKAGTALLIGLVAGLITLIRPPEILIILVPLLWQMHGATERKRKFDLLRKHAFHLVIAATAFVVVVFPQLLYWKTMTGEWITNSYSNNPGEGFDLLQPHTGPFLFSFRKGWFIYTPMMLLAILGIPLLPRKHREVFLPILIFLPIHLWIVSSWTTWWYAGGSFSSRSMVPAYVLLAIPLGALIASAASSRIARTTMPIMLAAFILLNVFQTWQWKRGLISKERMTGAYYKAIFGRTEAPTNAEELLLVDRSATAEESLQDSAQYLGRIVVDEQFDPPKRLDPDSPFLPGVELKFYEITKGDHAWIRATSVLLVDSLLTDPPLMVLTFHYNGDAYKYRSSTWPSDGAVSGSALLTMDYLTPEVRSRQDLFKMYLWNPDPRAHFIQSLRIEIFEPIER